MLKRARTLRDATLIDENIDLSEDERTALAKANQDDAKQILVDLGHGSATPHRGISWLQSTKNEAQVARAAAKRAIQHLWSNKPHVRFVPQVQVR